MWEIRLEPGQTIDFHIHYHPYLVVSLGGGENEIETIFGRNNTDAGARGLVRLHQRNARGSPAHQQIGGNIFVAPDRNEIGDVEYVSHRRQGLPTIRLSDMRF